MTRSIWQEHIKGGDSVWKGVHTHPDGTKTSSRSRNTRQEMEEWLDFMEEEDVRNGQGLTPAQHLIAKVCDDLKDLLIRKNVSYGNSAIEPRRTFCKADNITQIDARIDDKLTRIENGQEDFDQEDTIKDLAGYLILRMVAVLWNERKHEA